MSNSADAPPGYHILVVDDDEYICKLCRDCLSSAGFQVEATSSPRTALKRVSQNSFDLVLTDIKMPQIDGLELVRKIRSMVPDLPVVLMTGFASLETAVQAVNEGASNFVRKPFNMEELVLAVNKAVEQKRLLHENIRLKTLVNFFKVSETIGFLHDPVKIYTLLLQAAMKETAADRGGIYEYDAENGLYFLRYGANLNGHISKEEHFREDCGLPGLVFRRLSPLTIEDWKRPPVEFKSIGEEKWSRFAVGIPLKLRDEVRNVLCLYKTRSRFTEADIDGTLILVNQAVVSLQNADLLLELEILFLETMKSLATTLDARDPYTHGHSLRVAHVAQAIGKIMRLSERELEELELAGILHDIGKIGIPDSILFKPERLTEQEYEIIKTHTEKGYQILKHIKRLTAVAEAVYSHHEWYNGKGYPRGLKEEEIPLAGAIIAVADAFDTIVTDRHYRKRRTYEDAVGILRKNARTQFNPRVVEAFCKIPREELPQRCF